MELDVRNRQSNILKQEIHCMNRHMELAAKDALTNSFIAEVLTMLSNLHSMYECQRRDH